MTSDERNRLPAPDAVRDQRGAMFMMGIPICFFMIGLLYFVIGLGEGLVLRERMQDAADSGALTAAIIHARGMNLIALINMLMAALVSLLIMVRMLQVLLLAAIAIASALSIPTWGASMSVVPPAAAGAEEAQAVWEELQSVIDPIVQVLHGFEVGVQYAQPAVAEARTILIVKKYGPEAQFGIVIPGEYPLPLKNGTWADLCGKAGEYAAMLITYPLQKILPVPPVYRAIEAASSALSKSFAPLFCGGEGSSSISIPEELPSVPMTEKVSQNLPPLEQQDKCQNERAPTGMSQASAPVDENGIPIPADPGEEQKRIQAQEDIKVYKAQACKAASQETARAQPDDTGKPNSDCKYNYDVPAERGDPPQTPCDKGACLQGNTPCDEFVQKESQATTACAPGTKGVTGWNYQERQEKWIATLVPQGNCSNPDTCKYTVKFESETPVAESEKFVSDAPQPPCGSGQNAIGTEWNKNARWQAEGYHEDYLCSQPHTKVDKAQLEGESAQSLAAWQAEFGAGKDNSRWTEQYESGSGTPTISFVGSWTAVPYIHSCEAQIKDINQSQDYKDLAKQYIDQQGKTQAPSSSSGSASGSASGSQGSGGGCGDGDEVHLTMNDVSEDNVLGGETYQMRCIAFRSGADTQAKQVVREVPLHILSKNKDQNANPLGPFGALTRFFAAQAEYFYDTGYKGPADGPDQAGKDFTVDARKEWMWNMKWKARLRRLRFGSEDGNSSSQSNQNATANQSGGQGAGAACGADTPSMDMGEALGKAGGSSGDGEGLGLLKEVEKVIIH